MFQFLTNMFKKKTNEETIGTFIKKPKYTYGHILRKNGYGHTKIKARINHENGDCESILWKAGQQGHTEDCWHKVGAGHENMFVADSEVKQ